MKLWRLILVIVNLWSMESILSRIIADTLMTTAFDQWYQPVLVDFFEFGLWVYAFVIVAFSVYLREFGYYKETYEFLKRVLNYEI